jgi:hypothetical protein
MAKQVLTNVNVTFGTAATDISGYVIINHFVNDSS